MPFYIKIPDVNFTILHSLDGTMRFLDQSHKDNYQHHGRYAASRRLWCFNFKAKEIEGGTTIEDWLICLSILFLEKELKLRTM
jgi:hypothetical protein